MFVHMSDSTSKANRFGHWWRRRGSRIAAGAGLGLIGTVTLKAHAGAVCDDAGFDVGKSGLPDFDAEKATLNFERDGQNNVWRGGQRCSRDIWSHYGPSNVAICPTRQIWGDAPRKVVDAVWNRFIGSHQNESHEGSPVGHEGATVEPTRSRGRGRGRGMAVIRRSVSTPLRLSGRAADARVLDCFQVTAALLDTPDFSYPCPDGPTCAWLWLPDRGAWRASLLAKSGYVDLLRPNCIIALEKMIACGGMAKVYPASVDGNPLAVKILTADFNRSGRIESLAIHLEPHKNLCLPIAMLEIGISTGSRLALVSPLCKGGDVRQLIKQFPDLPLHLKLDIVKQAVEGVVHLHRQGVVHFDVKPPNILLVDKVTPQSKSVHAMVTDFGLIGREVPGGLNKRRGTPGCMAPEVLESKGITRKADIFSVGMMMYNIFNGGDWRSTPEYEKKLNRAIAKAVAKELASKESEIKDELWTRLADTLVSEGKRPVLRNKFGYPTEIWTRITALIKSCWQQKPDDRPDIQQVLLEVSRICELLGVEKHRS